MLFTQPLLEVDTLELLRLWGEFTEALHGVHPYGGHTAEIYGYRFQKYSPFAHTSGTEAGAAELEELDAKAANTLAALVDLFRQEYDCRATIDGMTCEGWARAVLFDGLRLSRRAHVRILPAWQSQPDDPDAITY